MSDSASEDLEMPNDDIVDGLAMVTKRKRVRRRKKKGPAANVENRSNGMDTSVTSIDRTKKLRLNGFQPKESKIIKTNKHFR